MNPSSFFKRDDRVEATNTYFKMHGTVLSVGAFTGLVRVRWDERPGLFGSKLAAFTEYVHPRHLRRLPRKVSQATFSKGDVVEIRTQHPSPEYQGALGVVVEVVQWSADTKQYKVRPYSPSKPFEELSRGPFSYWGRELVARKANGLVPVNFIRQALGLLPVDPRPLPQPDPSAWTLVGTTTAGAEVFTAPSGELPPTSFPGTSRHEGTVSIDFQVRQPDQLRRALEALSQPRSITISEPMRRRGITSEEAIFGLAERADQVGREAGRQRNRADFTKRLLREAQDSARQAESRARDLADERDRLCGELARARQAAAFNSEAHEAETARLRAERDELKRKVGTYQHREAARMFDPTGVPQLQDELHRAHASRQEAENERDDLKATVRDLRNQLGSAVNRSRRRGEAIERVQNAVRGL